MLYPVVKTVTRYSLLTKRVQAVGEFAMDLAIAGGSTLVDV